jgi:MFS transporter, AAHS family, 4-hydroxybenzoate transporter
VAAVTIDTSLDGLGLLDHSSWTFFQKRVLALAALAILLDGLDILLLGAVIPSLMQEWSAPRSAFVPIVILSIIGMSVGTFALGMLGDRLGRRPMMITCVALFAGGTLLGACSPGLLTFGLLRFAAAIGLGGVFPNAAALIAEFTPLRRRHIAISAAVLCVPIGGFLGGLAASELLQREGWRVLFTLGGALPLAVAGLMYFVLPESPVFLQRHETRRARLLETLHRCGLDVDNIPFGFNGSAAIAPRSSGVLLSTEFRRDTLALCSVWFCASLSVYAVFNWGPTLFNAAGFSVARASLALAAFNCGGIGGAFIGGWTMDRFGSRLPTVIYIGVGACLAIVLAHVGWPGSSVPQLYIGTFGLGVFFCGLMPMLSALATSVYPTDVRASGLGAAGAIGRLGAIGSALLGAGASTKGVPELLNILSVASLIGGVSLLTIRRHTAATA